MKKNNTYTCKQQENTKQQINKIKRQSDIRALKILIMEDAKWKKLLYPQTDHLDIKRNHSWKNLNLHYSI